MLSCHRWKYLFYILLFCFFQNQLFAETGRYRCTWRDDPATTMTIGWEQISGNNAVVFYDEFDGGQNSINYGYSQEVNRKVWAKGMHNHFARLTQLKPNTIYYFIIKDSEGTSRRMSFKTTPDNPYERLSFIAGGDSRNHRKARCKANSLVAKLRPHGVIFGGDMTGGDVAKQWRPWFDDWQKTITPDGHLTPIIPARGNHESSNESIVDLFDVKHKKVYYGLTFGGSLLRIYTLNSMVAAGGDQRNWLENDLQMTSTQWKFAQYHHAIRPHMSRKSERNTQLKNWATLFYEYGVNLVCESDAHVVKTTYPIRPSRESGSDEGFIRDDERGTVYVGEGCWGAPLRRNDDEKKWTRASGSFNQFKWIFVDINGIEVRTVKVDNAAQVAAVSPHDIFSEPSGIDIWSPPTGRVLRIENKAAVASYDYAPPQLSFPKPTPSTSTHSNNSNQNVASASSKKQNPRPARQKQKAYAAKKDQTQLQNARLISVKPIEIIEFEATMAVDEVTVKWTTKYEHMMPTFEIQRSTDGKEYSTFARIKGSGNTGRENLYKIVDDLRGVALGESPRYRLRHIAPNGEVLLLQAKNQVLENMEWNLHDKLETDPQTGQIQFKYKLENPANVSVKLVNGVKQEILKNDFKNNEAGNFLQSIDVSRIKKGEYLLIIEANQEVIQQYKVEKRI